MESLTTLVFCFSLFCLQHTASQADVGDQCENAAGTGGVGRCLAPRNCEAVMDAVRKDQRAMSAATLRLLQDAHCGFMNDKPLVCCPSAEEDAVDAVLNAEPGQWLDADDSVDAPVGSVVSSDHPKIPLLPIDRCGLSAFDRIGRPPNVLIESDDAPTIARLIYVSPSGEESFRCSGSLISSRYVLTSARCVSALVGGLKLAGVVLGDFDVTTDPDCIRAGNYLSCNPRARRYAIEDVKIHPAFRPRNRRPDIALIRLFQAVNFTVDDLIPTCLPLGNFQFVNLRGNVRSNLITMGWGADLRGNTESPKMRMGSLHAVDGERCEALAGAMAKDEVRCLCAEGRTEQDNKIADVGGPLSIVEALNSDDGPRMVQVAVLSVRVPNQPSAFTRIGPYLRWILNTMQS